MKTTLTVMVSFDVDKVNNTLGNTPNVDARNALTELLNAAIYEYDRYYYYTEKDDQRLKNHVSFEVL